MAFAEINGFAMHYEDTGQGDPIILQPGWISTGDAWAGIVPGLAGSYRCIVLETRGTGQSERVAGGHTIVQFADDLIALADHLSIDRFTIVGHSMGGVIATEVAAKVPQRVERLVYVASTADASYVPNEIWNMLLGLSDAIADGDKEAAKGFMMGITARREGVPFDLIAEAAVACSPEFIRDSIRSCAKFSPSRPPSAIETPALVIAAPQTPSLAPLSRPTRRCQMQRFTSSTVRRTCSTSTCPSRRRLPSTTSCRTASSLPKC